MVDVCAFLSYYKCKPLSLAPVSYQNGLPNANQFIKNTITTCNADKYFKKECFDYSIDRQVTIDIITTTQSKKCLYTMPR